MLNRLKKVFLDQPLKRSELKNLLLNSNGAIDPDEEKMLAGVLDVAETQVREVMVPRSQMVVIDNEDSLEDILRIIVTSGHSRFPVMSKDRESCIGVLLAKDLLRFFKEVTGDPIEIKRYLRPLSVIPESKRLNTLLKEFRDSHNHMAVVVDEYGGISGLLTIEDVLEEIVGEIDDEHDESITGIWPQDDGSWIIEGDTTIRDINRALDFNLPDDDAATLAGLVINESRTIPLPGQEFRFYQVRFRILRRNRNKIERVRIWPEPNHPDQNTKKTEESE